MLIIEIILTIIAWSRGWKAKSLIPLGCVVGIGFLIGLIMGSSGYSQQDIANAGWIIVFDIIGMLVLVGMIFIQPKSVKDTKEENK